MGSYLAAKKHHDPWLVRREDLDPPHEQRGAADHILQTLEAFGFEWDSIVRGADLLDNTPRHIYLPHCLELPTPQYAQLPIAVNEQGQKPSKQTFAPALDTKQASTLLYLALKFLQQPIPEELEKSQLADIGNWALQNWTIDRLRLEI